MKFDRVSGYNEITTATAFDSYTATGASREFDLTWAPSPDKNNITVKVDGIRVLSGDYTVEKYSEKYNGYAKQYGKIVLADIPKKLSKITIEYKKDHSLYHAVDRIRDYYAPVSGMPGNTATMLMNGLEYPGVTIDTLPFEVSKGWDTTLFGDSNWDDFIPEVGAYETKGPRVTATVAATTSISAGSVLYFTLATNKDITGVRVGSTVTIATVIYTVTSSTIDTANMTRWVLQLGAPVGVTPGASLSFVNPNPLIYTLPFVPTLGQGYNAYVKYSGTDNFVRIDTTATAFVGNGYVSTITVPAIYNSNDRVLFRSTSSDGSLPVVDLDLDTYINPNGATSPGWYY